MGKHGNSARTWLVCGVVVLLLILLAAYESTALRSSAPTFQGKPLSTWTLALNSATMHDRAEAAIRAAGTNAVPELARLLRTPDPPLARAVRFVARHTPDRLSRLLTRVFHPYSGSAQRVAAAQALRLLGSQAEAAVPALGEALQDERTVSWHAALALAQLGQPGTAALIHALPKSAPEQAGYICYALGTQGLSASNAIPILSTTLDSADPQRAEWAARALGDVGKLSVPNLLHSLEHTNPAVRVLAVNALGSIGPAARGVTPYVLKHALDDERVVRLAAVEVLAKIRPSGAGITGALTNLEQDPDPQIAAKARQALAKVTP